MDFRFTAEEEAFRQEVREFARRELPPGWLGVEEYTADVFPKTRAIARKLGERGWLALGWPKAYGGQGASFTRQLVFLEEAAYWGIPGTGMGVGGTAWVGPALLLFGTEAQKREHIPPIASGQRFWCTAYSEPGAGSDMAAANLKVTKKDGYYLLDGQKVWTSAAHVADWCWLLARTNTQVPKHRGLSLFLINMKTPGLTLRPILNLANLHSFNELYFDGVRVPVENRVGEEDRGWYYVVVALDMERASPGVRAAAVARRLVDELTRYVKERPGPSWVAQALAEAAVAVEVARLLGYRCLDMRARGLVPNYEASSVKVFASELVQRLSGLGLRVLGLAGQLGPGSPGAFLRGQIAQLYMVSRGDTIAAGTSEVQRNIIALRGLGLPREPD